MAQVQMVQLQQILLYKPGAKLGDQDLQRLRDAGFVPICVDDYADVKLMDVTGAVPAHVVFSAMSDAIANSDQNDGPKTRFGRVLAQKLGSLFLEQQKKS